MAFLKAFYEEKEVVQIVEEPKSPYNKAFVKKIEKARNEMGKEILPNEDLWEAIK